MSDKENALWAHHLIDAFIHLNCQHFVVCPGSRSTPLTLSLAGHKKAKSYIHYDERGAAFFALGMAKAMRKPVALITTSGSAVGNLLPALMEADQSSIPLILITADRPAELLDIGSNQTTAQIGIFKDFVRWQHHLCTPTDEVSLGYLRSVATHATYKSRSGPVHLNVPFREPLYQNLEELSSLPTSQHYPLKQSLHLSVADSIAKVLVDKKAIIILGDGAINTEEEAESINTFATSLSIPILSDISSGYRGISEDLSIKNYLAALKTELIEKPEVILHFGTRMVSKALSEWIKSSTIYKYYHISISEKRYDPQFLITDYIKLTTQEFIDSFKESKLTSSCKKYYQSWQQASSEISRIIKTEIEASKEIQELSIPYILSHFLPPSFNIFISSSMPIRDADYGFFPQNNHIKIFSSRGVSGIDGNLSTALGIACTSERSTLAIVGDLATLHDLNSLALTRYCKQPFILLVINNDGGGIFSSLQVAQQTKHFEKFFATPHGYDFEMIAKMFKLDYLYIESKKDLEAALKNINSFQSALLIEVKTNRKENYEFRKSLDQVITGSLCSTANR